MYYYLVMVYILIIRLEYFKFGFSSVYHNVN